VSTPSFSEAQRFLSRDSTACMHANYPQIRQPDKRDVRVAPKSISLSDLESGRKFFLCWMPKGSWVQTDLVLMENSDEVGRYHSNLGRREDGLLDYATGMDTLVLIAGIASPIPLLILWIGMLAEFLRVPGNE